MQRDAESVRQIDARGSRPGAAFLNPGAGWPRGGQPKCSQPGRAGGCPQSPLAKPRLASKLGHPALVNRYSPAQPLCPGHDGFGRV